MLGNCLAYGCLKRLGNREVLLVSELQTENRCVSNE